MCHDCNEYVDLQKLHFGTFFKEGIKQGKKPQAEILMQFMEEHKMCSLGWTGEYAGVEFGFPPEKYKKTFRN